MSKGEWERVTPQEPCPYCNQGDHRCSISKDGTRRICFRVNDGTGEEKVAKDGAVFYCYRLKPDHSANGSANGRAHARSGPRKPGIGRADRKTRHEVYSALLAIGNLALSETNRADLERRGFPIEEARRRQYRSRPSQHIWQIAYALVEQFGQKTLLTVPGFYLNRNGAMTFGGRPGKLLPARDVDGLIAALSCSPDKRDGPDAPKYFWLTSAGEKRGNGPKAEALIHVPLGIDRPAKIVRVSEGVLKPDLAQILSGLPTVGLPGVNNSAGLIPVLKALGAEVVRLAFDADWKRKPEVTRAFVECARRVAAAGFVVEVEDWDEADGKGIDDLLAAGKVPDVLTGYAVEALIDQAEASLPSGQAKAEAGGGGRGGGDNEKETQAEVLLRLATVATLFHSPDMRTYASIPADGHVQNHIIRSTSFRRWLTRQFYDEMAKPPSAEALNGALNVLEAQAQFDGPQESVSIRVAGAGTADSPTFFLDLCDDQWRVVEITGAGWRVLDQAPVKFRRSKGMLALPVPERGGKITDIRPYLNVTDEDWMLWVASETASLRPFGPYPIQAYTGEQGSAKSTTSRVTRRLTDPHVTPLRSEPKEVRDLMIAAHNTWDVAYDNLSGISVWLSDALCCLATGGGFGTRELYANEEETFFDAMRPVLLNGIEDYAARGDLIDRCVFFHLPRIPEEKRREERPFWDEFEAAQPKLLGALLDAVVGGIRELPNVKLDRLPRMADFARWGEAVGRALGWPAGAFLEAYASNRASANEVALEDSAVASALRKLLGLPGQEWKGTATDLLNCLNEIVSEETTASKRWPKSPRGLSSALRRVAPALRTVGVHVDFDRQTSKARTRQIHIKREAEHKGEQPSEPSGPSEADEAEHASCVSSNDLRQGSASDAKSDANAAPDANAVETSDAQSAPDGNADGGAILRPTPGDYLKSEFPNGLGGNDQAKSDGPDRSDAKSPSFSAHRAAGMEEFDL